MGNTTGKQETVGGAGEEQVNMSEEDGETNPSLLKHQFPRRRSWVRGDDEQSPCIPTLITWSYGGSEVSIEGTWDDYTTRKEMKRSGKEFILVKVLPPGVYRYRFVVDGESRYTPDQPYEQEDEPGSDSGNVNFYNILDLKDYTPENISSVSSFKSPESPESSYNDSFLVHDDFSKEPPPAPPHLNLTLLNQPPDTRSRPSHVVLDHLYMHRDRTNPSVIALGSTTRIMSKYVTVVLYTSMKK